MRLLFPFLLLSIFAFSQKIELGHIDSIQKVCFYNTNKQFYIFYKHRYEKLNLFTLERTSKKAFIPDEFSFMNYEPILMDSTQYFVSTTGGAVYILKNDSIQRIDNSFDHRMQLNSILFKHDSKLIKYGGYGFWSSRNFYTYFDVKSKDWEVISPVNSKRIPDGTHSGNFIKIGNDIYVFNGRKVNPYDRIEFIENNEIWKYNLKDNIWKYLGKTSKSELNSFFMGEMLILDGENKFYAIDILKNKMITYRKPPLIRDVLNKGYSTINIGFNPFLFNGKTYFLGINDEHIWILNHTKPIDFFGDQIAESEFYTQNSWYIAQSLTWLSVMVFVMVSAIFGFKKYKRRNKILLLDNGLKYKNKFTEFDSESMEIIRVLLYQNNVTSNTILKIVEKDQYSVAHNERLKIQKLHDINLKIETLKGKKEDVIKYIRSKTDKRIRCYFINKELFHFRK